MLYNQYYSTAAEILTRASTDGEINKGPLFRTLVAWSIVLEEEEAMSACGKVQDEIKKLKTGEWGRTMIIQGKILSEYKISELKVLFSEGEFANLVPLFWR